MVNYTIGDFLIRLKNASMAGKKEVVMPKSKLVVSLAELLKSKGYIRDIDVGEKEVLVSLAYHKKQPVLADVKVLSKPGLRVYKKARELKQKKGVSWFIVSTSKGLMSSAEAAEKSLGGEVIAEIW